MKKNKVLMLNSMSFLPHQGRFIRIYNEAKTLVDNGFDVTLIAWDRQADQPKTDERDGIKIERIRIKAGIERGPLGNGLKVLLFNLLAFCRLMARKCDVIHCFNLDTIPAGFLAAKLKRKKAVLDLCEPNYYAFWQGKYAPFIRLVNWIEKITAKSFDYLLVHNLFQVNKFRRFGIKNFAQIGTFPNRDQIVKQPPEHENDAPVVIGRIGTIYQDNGIEETIAGFTALPENDRAKLFLAGRVYDHYRPVFTELTEPIKDRAKIHGAFEADDLVGLYAGIDISVILNRSRSAWFKHITPTKLFDSLANGVPVVGSDIGDMKEILTANNCGIVVDETNPQEVAAALHRLITDHELRRKMAANGLRLIKEKYNWDLMAKRMIAIYQGLLR